MPRASRPRARDIVGTVGYCMSGRYAINAATHFPDRVKAAASIYGTHLATDQPDSPHLAGQKTKAELYFGCAETDIYAPMEIIEKVKQGMKDTAPMPRSRSIPAPITASRFRSGRSTIATRPSGIGNGCWRSIAATSRHKQAQCPSSPSPFRSSIRSPSRSARSRSAGMRWPISAASCSAGSTPAR